MDITNGKISENLLSLWILLIFSDFVRQFPLDLRMSLMQTKNHPLKKMHKCAALI